MNWPLNVNNFNSEDIEKICSFLKNPNSRWTQDNYVEEFENKMAKFANSKYSIFVSSGSTANTLIAMNLKDNFKFKKIIFPSTTWITSISPFIREGFEPVFIDVNLQDLALDLDKAEQALQTDSEIGCIFITSLLGFVPDVDRLNYIAEKYKVLVMMDNCENTFGKFKDKNISSYFTSTTSTYFGHQLQSIEGGFIFTNNESEYDYFLMSRNHGMTRSLKTNKEKYKNSDVDERFDFYTLGNNFRNTNLNAFIGLLDFNKVDCYVNKRVELYTIFKNTLNMENHILPNDFNNRSHVAFCLPVISKNENTKNVKLKICENLGVETRPIISGNLLKQTALKKYGNYKNYQNSEFLHNNGFYVGLHVKLTEKDVSDLTKEINKYD
jgi:CDP-6-deoxy-D-xylo-4-hexulose-3-dehydrase